MKKLFAVQTNLTSYMYPIVKLAVCISIIILSILRDKVFSFSRAWIDITASVLLIVLGFLSILVIYISIGEMFHTYSNRKCTHFTICDAVAYTVNDVVAMAESQDIIEVELFTPRGALKVGSSSDNVYADTVFFDKQYYIGDHIYKTIAEFSDALLDLSQDHLLHILSIDGISVKR